MKSLPFFKGLTWLIFLNLLVKPAWIFFIDRQVQNIVGHEAFGQYFAILNLSFVLFFLADAGLSTMMNQRLASSRKIHTANLLGFKFFLVSLFIITTIFVAWLSHISQWQILLYVITIQSLNSIFIFLRSMITAHQNFRADAWLSVTDKFLMTVFCGLLIYTSSFGTIDIILFLQVQTLCTAIAVIIAFAFVFKKKFITRSETQDLRNVIPSILPFAIIILLMSVQSRMDAFLLDRMHINGSFEAGIYATAYRLLDAGNMAGYLAASFLVPFIARNQNNTQLISKVLVVTRYALLLLAFGVASFSFFNAGWIQQLLYHSNDTYNTLIIQLCLLVLPALYMVHVYGSTLTATSRFRELIIILVVSVAINIILNLVLIPDLGAEGCCIAAIASQYFCGIACYVTSVRLLSLSPGLRSLTTSLFIAALLCLLFYFGKMVISNVWVILAMAIVLVLIVITTQTRKIKTYFTSIQ